MKGTIAILESRLGSQLADLIARHGGTPLLAPAITEVPDNDDASIARLVQDLQTRPAKAAIFQTGVGTRALFEAVERLGLLERFKKELCAALIVSRGPKPAGVLRARGVRIDVVAGEPFTTEEVLAALKDVPLAGERVMVQRYGAANAKLAAALKERGAEIIEIPTYRWALPEDTAPLERLIEALARREVAAVVFTNGAQADNLFAVARGLGKEGALRADLNATLVASIGPVCSAVLRAHGIAIGIEPHPPKLGALVSALEEKFPH